MINTELLINGAKELNIELDDKAVDRFIFLEERLARWNERTNLTAITEPDDVVVKHFIDSLTALYGNYIPEEANVIDIGCGAGFPGLPILIARPDLELTFIDSTRKKLGFTKEYLRLAGLVATVHHGRAEELGATKEYREQFDVCVTRAVSAQNVLAEYCLPFVKVGGVFISLKGANDEVENARNATKLLGGKIENIIALTLPNGDARHVIVTRKVKQTPSKYPRKQAKITKKPL